MKCIWNPPVTGCPKFGNCDPKTAWRCYLDIMRSPVVASGLRLNEEGVKVIGKMEEEYEMKMRKILEKEVRG